VSGGNGPFSARATLERRFGSPEEAEALLKALAPDNADFLSGRTEGPVLHLEARAKGLAELQRTLDDALACLSTAERTWEAAHRSAPARTARTAEARDPPC